MAALATYTDLLAEVQDWLFGRSDIAAKVPTFVRLCEAKANRTLMARQMEDRAFVTLDLTVLEPQFVTLPDNFQAMRRIRLKDATNGPKRLKFATGAQLDDLRDRDDNQAGEPAWFSVFGTQLELYPTPASAYTLEMVYRATIPALTDAAPTNWLLTLAPDFYLYGTLTQAAPYLHEDERIATWQSGLASAIAELNALSDEALYNAGPITARRVRRAY